MIDFVGTHFANSLIFSDPFFKVIDFEVTHYSKWHIFALINFEMNILRYDSCEVTNLRWQSFKVMDFEMMNFEMTYFESDRLRSDPFLELTDFEVTHFSKWLNFPYGTFRSYPFLKLTDFEVTHFSIWLNFRYDLTKWFILRSYFLTSK